MNRLRIGTRLALAFGLLLLITALIAAVGVWRLGSVEAASHQIASVEMERATLASHWAAGVRLNWVRASAALKTSDAVYIDALQKEMADTSRTISSHQKKLEALIQDDQGRQLLADIGERLSAAARRWSSAPPVPRQISVDGPNRRSCDGMLACGAVGQCKFQTPLAWPMRGVGTAKRLAARGLTGA